MKEHILQFNLTNIEFKCRYPNRGTLKFRILTFIVFNDKLFWLRCVFMIFPQTATDNILDFLLSVSKYSNLIKLLIFRFFPRNFFVISISTFNQFLFVTQWQILMNTKSMEHWLYLNIFTWNCQFEYKHEFIR